MPCFISDTVFFAGSASLKKLESPTPRKLFPPMSISLFALRQLRLGEIIAAAVESDNHLKNLDDDGDFKMSERRTTMVTVIMGNPRQTRTGNGL